MHRFLNVLIAFITIFFLTSCAHKSQNLDPSYTGKKLQVSLITISSNGFAMAVPIGSGPPKIKDPDGLIQKTLIETTSETYNELKKAQWFTVKDQREVTHDELDKILMETSGLIATASHYYSLSTGFEKRLSFTIYDNKRPIYSFDLESRPQLGGLFVLVKPESMQKAMRQSTEVMKAKIQASLDNPNVQQPN